MTSDSIEYVLVTERFHPDTTSSTGQYMTDLAAGLQERGLQMTVYTRQLQRHRNGESRDDLEDVTVKRLQIPEIPQSSFLGRIFNWLTFILAVIPLLLISRPNRHRELIFVTYPTIIPPLLWVVCKVRGWQFTYIIYDYYPACAVQLGYIKEGGIIHRGWSRVNRAILHDAKHIVALGPVMRQRIIESTGQGFDQEKISIIHNWADGDFIEPIDKQDNWFSKKHDLIEPFSLVYSGNIGEYHDVETVIRGAAQRGTDDVKVMIIGEGDNREHLIEVAEDLDVLGGIVEILPYQPWEVVPYSFTSGDVSIVAVNEGFEGLCVSSKLYSALAAGKPILVISDEHDDEARIVTQYDAGIQVDPGDIDGVIDAIERWMEQPELVVRQGSNARQAFEAHFTTSQSIDKYYQMLCE